ncbi:DUF6020 family protein [Adlercreutzia murintestinalis]|uniref:DUF6020 family protein n=1 Tax=Adlercreutzia murintestinalis TaxID=2941325 RepID=UPI00203BF482|nr:DUF6020 family protein [Adlercreutzia murintestinalis]
MVIALALAVLVFIALVAARQLMGRLAASHRGNEERIRIAFPRTARFFFVCFALLEVVLLIVVLSNYPGFVSFDSFDSIRQVLGTAERTSARHYDGLMNYHPIFFTFLVGVAFSLATPFGDIAVSVFVFSLIQITATASVLAWALTWLDKRGVGKPYLLVATAFLLFSPVVMIHAITMWKDVVFSLVMLVYILKLFDFACQDTLSRKDMVLFVALSLGLIVLRNNGIYIVLATLVFMFIGLDKVRKLLACVACALIAFVLVVNGPVFSLLQIQNVNFSESLSIPLQQVAAVLHHGGKIDEDQKDFLDKIRPVEEMASSYRPECPDPIKYVEDFDESFLADHKLEFLMVWAQLMPENLGIYTRAWIKETEGYWHPGYLSMIGTPKGVVATERHVFKGLGEQDFDFSDPVDLIGLDLNIFSITNTLAKDFPGLFSMGTIVWVVIFGFVFSLLGREVRGVLRFLSFVPLLALLFTLLIAVPISWFFRYILAFYLVIPFLPVLSGIAGCCRVYDGVLGERSTV